MTTRGDRIGRYELVAPLGEGGMGEVWEALLRGPAGFCKPVALKLLRETVADSFRDALIREARLGAMLAHPNVVATYELGQAADGRWFVAMELVRGPTVSTLAASGPVPGDAVLEIGIQACAGLSHIHSLVVDGRPAGLVHRDVKPENLLVDRSGLIKLVDLGVARLRGDPGEPAGTRGYMPPEQAAGVTDPRSDLYALGVTLYKLCARRKPTRSASMDPVEAVVPGLGPVLARVLQPDPADRYADANELQAALRAVRGRSARGPGLPDVLRARGGRFADATPVGGTTADTVTRTTPEPLPAARDAFVGRSDELDALLTRLRREQRLVTLLGPGGMGKTRLAVEAAQAVQHELPVVFCDLSAATTVEGIATAVAEALRVPLDRDDPAGRIGEALAGRGRILLVLDNLEQAVSAAPGTIGAWMGAAPHVQFLVTSRVALRLRGERLVTLAPLALQAAAELFVARAAREVPDDELPRVHELVRRLDGLPLAIELAAARTRVLSVPDILGRLEDRFRLLASTSAELPERHRSLRASLDGSWELLPPWGRAALAQLSVFAGGWTLPAAEGVVDLPEGAPWLLDVLDELGAHSLIVVDPTSGRFRMLVAVQEYAASHLDSNARAAAEGRHAAFFARLGEVEDLARIHGRGGQARWEVLAAELENLVAATRRSIGAGHRDVAAACALAAWMVFERRGPFARGEALLRAAHEVGQGPRTGDLLRNLGIAHRLAGRTEASRACLEQSLGMCGPRADCQALIGLANLDMFADPARGRATYERALDLARSLGERALVAICLTNIATTHALEGRVEGSVEALREAHEAAREEGARRAEATATLNLGNALLELGRPAEAQRLLVDARRAFREVGERMLEGIALGNLGAVLARRGRYVEARRRYESALRLARAIGNKRSEAVAMANLGELDRSVGDHEAALERLHAARKLQQTLDNPVQLSVIDGNLGALHLAEGRLDLARTHLQAALRVRPTVQALGHLAWLAWCEGDPDAACRHTDEALELATSLDRPAQVARARLDRARVFLALGRRDEAASEATEALRLLDRRGIDPDEIAAEALRAAAEGDEAGLAEAGRRVRALGVGPRARLAQLVS